MVPKSEGCETQLVQFVHDIISNGAVNHGHKQTHLIIMGFAKAFDKVLHRRLCYMSRIMLGSLTLTSDLVSRMGVESGEYLLYSLR